MTRPKIDLASNVIEIPDKLLTQEPTHVSRYWIIAQMVASISGRRKTSVLDVGGKKGLLRPFGIKPTVTQRR